MYLGIALKGFMFLAMMYMIVYPVERLVKKHLPEGKLKKLLFFSWEA